MCGAGSGPLKLPSGLSVVKLFVCRQMEAGSLVSCREDISSLFPEQTPGVKYKVGYSVGYCRWSLSPLFTLPHNNHTYCPLLGFKQPVFHRQTSARRWELLLQSSLLRTLGVSPTQCQGSAEVSYHHYCRLYTLKSLTI